MSLKSSVEEFLRASNRTHAIRGPPALHLTSSSSLPVTNGLYQAPEHFQLGEVVHIPQLWAQVYNDVDEQAVATNLLGDNNWNSWSEDPIDKIQASVSSMTWATLHSTPTANTYYVEYWYAENDQVPLVAIDANGYQVGDASAEPQNIFDAIKTGVATTDSPFPVKGFKLGTPIPSTSYVYKFKAYLGRVTYLMADSAANTRVRYFVNFVPLSSTEKGFTKILSKIEKTPFIDLDNTDLATYDANFNTASIEPAILETDWDQTDIVKDALRMVIKSKSVIHNGVTNFIQAQVGATIEHSQVLTLNPNLWDDTDKPHYVFGIVSPQATLECWISHLSIGKISIVYRAIVRGWVIRSSTGAVANNSDVYIYKVIPPSTSTGHYTFERLLGISSTNSSSSGNAGVTYQASNALQFYRQSISKDNKEVPPAVLSNIPENVSLYTDTTSDLVNSLVIPNYQFHLKIKSFYTGTTAKIYGNLLNTLLQQGSYRWSSDEGRSWTAWSSIGQTTPYINSSEYLGTGALPLLPGFQTNIGEVQENTFLSPGEYLTSSSTSARKQSNDYIEISFDLT